MNVLDRFVAAATRFAGPDLYLSLPRESRNASSMLRAHDKIH